MAPLAIALISAAILLLEITFTRILSVVLWYHFAFLTVSLAMLGLGLPGVWFTLRPPGERALRWSLVVGAAAIPVGLLAIFHLGALLPWVPGTVARPLDLIGPRVMLAVGSILVPMIALGSAVVLLLLRAEGPAFARMYAADLCGAALGAALAIPLMRLVPTPVVVAACGFLPLIALWTLERRLPAAAWVIGAVLIGLILWREPLRLRYNKTYKESGLLLEKWTPTARLSVFSNVFWRRNPSTAFGWGMGTRFVPYTINQLWLEQDGSAGTPITKLDRPLSAFSHFMYDVTSVGYQWRPPRTVCVIGAGGGRDVLTALAAGAQSVDAVELNGGIVGLLRTRFREFCGDLYDRPDVTAHVEEGRAYLTRTHRAWDLIQISLIDSFSATAAGAYALSENNLYTVEAARLYVRRLSPTGVLSVSRWTRLATGLEVPRLVLLLQRALEWEGFARPLEHLAVIEGGIVATVLVSRTPIGTDDVAALDAICAERGFTRLWPAGASGSPVAEVLQSGPNHYTAMGIDLSPPTDDRPFFFQLLPVLGKVDPGLVRKLSVNEGAVILLRWLMAFVTAIAVLLFFLPFALARRIPQGPGFWRGSGYFAAIGLAFILIETGFISRFILYLGHPSHATTVVLTAMLLGAGMGSLRAARAGTDRAVRWGGVLPALLAVITLVLPVVFTATLGWPFGLRMVASLVLLIPVSFLMGFAFPLGMSRFGEQAKAWYWALNGVSGVLAGVLSLALAIQIGFEGVLWLGTAGYLAAWLLVRWMPRRLDA
jgi:hypothetical protein